MPYVPKLLTRNVLIPLGLKVAVFDNRCSYFFKKNMIRYDNINHEEMNDIKKITKFLQESGLLIKGVNG